MIGEFNGQAYNSEIPINGYGSQNRIVLGGFLDTIAAPLFVYSALQVLGFVDTEVHPVVMWDGTEETCPLFTENRCTIIVSDRDKCGDGGC